MSKSKFGQVLEFSLEGRFLGFEMEDGYKFKRIRVATPEGEVCIKLSKESRASVVASFIAEGKVLNLGDWIRVTGEKKLDSKTGFAKLKAYAIYPAVPGEAAPAAPQKATPAPGKTTILVCQKSDCMKRGARAVCQALESELGDRGLTNQVTIKGTGCMKHCKAGPTMVVMPDKTRYTRIHPETVSTILDEHFPTQPSFPATEGDSASKVERFAIASRSVSVGN
ncbi:(2Fe-2S) ferredoxin domain-containing protein [Trichocoleus sp. FACHB-591]|uniref:(2Fe-2S) ferredoxin domain-containing protein n=1 Tax=Trichocoleus sp. FACHB-591 TaxID=2692872 RepID=UPI001683C402|nr:(2Fe-2S) ferredoxin domain-containing protein [Trichocoleus sp. FACHB-591]MBD2095482.1 (2Fe-2S) ferredoxin domain-containing protein [Trichocoleus sp. FACHB-591]